MYLRLLRHAKSDWGNTSRSDRERGLNNRGRRSAPLMGAALAERLEAQCVHVSPARRAQLTLGGVCDAWPELAALRHVTEEDLYTFSVHDLVDWLRGQVEREDRFLIGHNPAFTNLVNWCCGHDVLDHLPTAGFAEIELSIDHWAEFARGSGKLVFTLFPRELMDG